MFYIFINNKIIRFSKKVIIGRNTSQLDFFKDNKKISRKHLEIKKVKDQIYITDLNSGNGTFLNEKKLESNKAIPINKNDKIEMGGQIIQLLTQKDFLDSNGEYQLFENRNRTPFYALSVILLLVYLAIQHFQSNSKSPSILSLAIVGILVLFYFIIFFIFNKIMKKHQLSQLKEVILSQERLYLIYHNDSISFDRTEITSITASRFSFTIHTKSNQHNITQLITGSN